MGTLYILKNASYYYGYDILDICLTGLIEIYYIEWTRGMWADCGNVNSPVSLGLFEGENKSKYFQKSLPQLCM